MVLGVFLHASFLYAAGKTWLVKDNDSSSLLYWVNASIHFFRIPCFFILSGFFSQMLLHKYGQGKFLRARLRRLALPLLSTAILFNSVQSYFLHAAKAHGWSLAGFLASPDYGDFWKSGEWIGHLWFLVDVLIYSAVAAGLWGVWKRLRPHAAGIREHLSKSFPTLSRLLIGQGLFMLLLPAVQLAAFAAASFLPFLYWNWGGLSGYELAFSFPYYFLGLLLFLEPRLRESFHRVRPWQILSIPVAVALEFLLDALSGSDAARAAIFYLDAYVVWCCCALLFAAFRFLLNRKYRIFVYLSEASYSIYLFHHVCVVGLGLYMARKEWNVFLEFGLILGVSLAVSLAFHHYLVLRVRVLRLLFTGK
ncbi:MAG: acyltransferase 3 [Fibrobacteres bacterium]|nr:acyltransferase 3 [Fibrobacterota bacterium]